ncbi:serine/threonine-protein phosphatase 4 regulatory subunit 4 [Exaiptasia diaphana]|uniref:Serine/threonine-protein phosphatase 4 regulatory subunit 4 n=1 Tax=Exaiptasia diaphana TaxID=2652724 RepID=A0A913YHB1_EXADI|nr:serine/threonine-protein phosphatase 4 regulatory subunit 4 [Exaiptasia diaphana]
MDWAGAGPLGEEDVEELRSERSIRGLKSAEEIERLTVDENLDEIERSVFLMSSGIETQKLSVLNKLGKLLETNSSDVNRRVIPLLRDYLHIAPVHIQLAATKTFMNILQTSSIPIYLFASSLLSIILHNIENKDSVVASAWLEALLFSINYLPKDIIKREVLPIAIAKGQLSQSVTCRLASCKLLGNIAPKFEPFWIKKELMTLVTSLSQDVDYEVRACMCQELEPVARALGWETTKTMIIPELVELTNDEENSVRLAGLETITNLLNLLDDDTCTKIIIPLVQRFCENCSKYGKESICKVAKLFGKLCHGLSVNFDESQKKWFLDYYRKLSVCGNPNIENRVGCVTLALQNYSLSGATIQDDDHAECRRCCAFNLPAMVLFSGPQRFSTELYSTFHNLVQDPHALVRRTVACGFHEVAKLLGSGVGLTQRDLGILLKDESIEVLQGLIQNLPESLECLATSGHASKVSVIIISIFCTSIFYNMATCVLFCMIIFQVAKLLGSGVGLTQRDLGILLKDESIEVLQGLIQNLPESLECLATSGHASKLNNLSDLIASLIACELAVASSSNWRLHVELLEKFACFPKCLTSEQIYYKFVPLLFRLLSSNRVLPVKLKAAHTLCVFIRFNRRFEHRQELCCRLIQECGRGKSFKSRLLFIDICKYIMELFSRSFFKENFFEFLLELASDPVLNVRLKFCSVLPTLKSVLKLSDRALLQQLEQCVRKLLSSEQEPDVCSAVREAVMKLDKIEIAMDTFSRRTMFEDDLNDQKKEEEEKLLKALEDKEKEEMTGGRQQSDFRKKGTSKDDKNAKKGSIKNKTSKTERESSNPKKTVNAQSTSGTSVSSKQGQKGTSYTSKSSSSSKGSPSSSLQRLPTLSSALPTLRDPPTSSKTKSKIDKTSLFKTNRINKESVSTPQPSKLQLY